MRTFYGTFGHAQYHPLTGQHLVGAYVELVAEDYDAAQAMMVGSFGEHWSAIREEKPDEGRLESLRVPLAPRPSDERTTTVTLRIEISEEAAKEKTLTVAGRCIAHRRTGGKAHNGAGVWFEDNRYPAEWEVNTEASGILGAGVIALARFIPKELAERAAAGDPAHISIVPGSQSLGVLARWTAPRPPHKEYTPEQTADMNEDHFGDESWREPVPVAMYLKPDDLEEFAKDARSAFLSKHLLLELERVEHLAIWRDEIVSVELRRDDSRGVEVHAIHVRSR